MIKIQIITAQGFKYELEVGTYEVDGIIDEVEINGGIARIIKA